MFQNRIAKYYSKNLDSIPAPPTASEPTPKVPPGFVALPEALMTQQFPHLSTMQTQLYREAYEAAKAEAREKLLQLLRSRSN